ncbi:hypothetical protein ILYODFUR_023623, partial [Ilyodon furcidens]
RFSNDDISVFSPAPDDVISNPSSWRIVQLKHFISLQDQDRSSCSNVVMATFVSLATCHHCPITSTRQGLIYRDSLSVLSRNLRAPRSPHIPASPQLQGLHSCRVTRADLPENFTASQSKASSSVKHLVVTHLRRLLMA